MKHKVGDLRPTQLLHTYGVGAMVDLPSIAAMVMGLEDWDVANAMPVSEELEYYAFKLSINSAKTVGTGACDGCLDPVCIVLNEIKLTQPVGVGNYRLQNPALSYYATWQGGVVSGGCPAATPARNRTWGAVKSLRP